MIAPMRDELAEPASTSSTISPRRTSPARLQILVADGGSDDGSVERLRSSGGRELARR